MQSAFWTNTIWYVFLGIIAIITMVFTLYKSVNRKFIIGFSFAVLGVMLYVEFTLVTILNAYSYFPKISSKQFLDSVIGNYFSQFLLVATAILIIVYKIPTIWNFIIVGIYCFIEEFFLKLGVYQHHWYKTWHTFIIVLLLFWVAKKWYNNMSGFPNRFIYYLSLFTGANALFSITIMIYFYAFSIEVINLPNVFTEFLKNQILFIIALRSIMILIMIILYQLKLKWVWRGTVFVFLFIIQYFLIKTGIITIKDGWFWTVTLLNIFGSYFWVSVEDYLLSKGTIAIQGK